MANDVDNLTRSFQMLEIPFGASKSEIEQAYKTLVLVWHPDRFRDNPKLKSRAEQKMRDINIAYDTLRKCSSKQYRPHSGEAQNHDYSQNNHYQQNNNSNSNNYSENNDTSSKSKWSWQDTSKDASNSNNNYDTNNGSSFFHKKNANTKQAKKEKQESPNIVSTIISWIVILFTLGPFILHLLVGVFSIVAGIMFLALIVGGIIGIMGSIFSNEAKNPTRKKWNAFRGFW